MNGPTQACAPREVRIPSGDAWLYGDLALPPRFAGVVLFAHGSGSGRHSARNRQVAQRLQQAGIATLLFDLLTSQEEQVDMQTREHRFDIPLLARRMQDATAWAASQRDLRDAPVGYFGASTGERGRADRRGPAGRPCRGRRVARRQAGPRRPRGTGGSDRADLAHRGRRG